MSLAAVLGFLGVRNRNAVLRAVAPDRNFDHTCDGSMLLNRRNAKRLFKAGVYTKCVHGSLDADHIDEVGRQFWPMNRRSRRTSIMVSSGRIPQTPPFPTRYASITATLSATRSHPRLIGSTSQRQFSACAGLSRQRREACAAHLLVAAIIESARRAAGFAFAGVERFGRWAAVRAASHALAAAHSHRRRIGGECAGA